MPNEIRHKTSTTAGAVPTAAQLVAGELAVNAADGKVYTRRADGTVVDLTDVQIMDGGEQFTPLNISNLALWLDGADTSTLYTTDAGPVTAVNSPLDITANPCLCWYDAADATSVTQSSGLVSQWNDKSGNGRHATASGSLRPTHGGSQNGRTVMQFTGTQSMTISGNFLQIDNVTLIAVAARNADGFGGIITSAPTNPEESPLLAFWTNPQIAFINRRITVTSPVANGVYSIITGQSAGANQIAHFNGARGTDTSTGTATNTTNTITKIGVIRTIETGSLNGNIAEIIAYSGNLSDSNRARVEAYLAAKWGIAQVHTQATTTSAPVGQWRDKSGNNRHMLQATAANRPAISATTTNGRNTLTWNGSTSRMRTSTSAGMGQTMSLFAVVKRGPTVWGGGGAGGYGTILGAGSSLQGPNLMVSNGVIWLTGAQNKSMFTPSGVLGITAPVMFTGTLSAGGTALYVNSALADSDPITGSFFDAGVIEIGAYNPWSQGGGPLAADIAELITYSRVLTAAERRRVEQYLATKWGLNIVPQVSNLDAQDWLNRVYLAGSTVTQGTAAAVNNFCNAIDSAGLRDRFYRLNLFCGDNLTACLVPLYRGPSLTATQLGNATDVNTNFVAADYNERNGLQATATGTETATKSLNSGAGIISALPNSFSGHISACFKLLTTPPSGEQIGMSFADAAPADVYFTQYRLSFSATAQLEHIVGGIQQVNRGSLAVGSRHFAVATRQDQNLLSAFLNGGSELQNGNAISTTRTLLAGAQLPWFGITNGTNPVQPSYKHIISSYTFGLALTNAQVVALNTAMQAFNTALGRT